MHDFAHTATRLLTEYKFLIKKQFKSTESTQKLSEFGLNERLPAEDAELYNLCATIMDRAREEVNQSLSRSQYSGVDQFFEYMQSQLKHYQLDNGRVVHILQRVSKIMLEAIQLMSAGRTKLTETVVQKLLRHADFIATHGSSEQQRAFLRSLQAHTLQDSEQFIPLLNHYQEQLQKKM